MGLEGSGVRVCTQRRCVQKVSLQANKLFKRVDVSWETAGEAAQQKNKNKIDRLVVQSAGCVHVHVHIQLLLQGSCCMKIIVRGQLL